MASLCAGGAKTLMGSTGKGGKKNIPTFAFSEKETSSSMSGGDQPLLGWQTNQEDLHEEGGNKERKKAVTKWREKEKKFRWG